MPRNELAFALRSEPTAAKEARAKLGGLETLGPDQMAAVKTIVSSLLTRAMREDGDGPFTVQVDVKSGAANGWVRSSHGWASLRAAPRTGSRDGSVVLEAFASSWRVDGDTVRFAVS